MAKRRHFMIEDQYVKIGRRYGCDDVALEAEEASARWTRDLHALAEYGHGQAAQAEFESTRATHVSLRAARPEAVAGKRLAVAGRNKHYSGGWTWVEKVTSALGMIARSDEAFAAALEAATPVDDAGLQPGIQALAKLVVSAKSKLPADAKADDRLAEVNALCALIDKAPGEASTAKSQTVADTAQIDLYDGKLYVAIRDLNTAGRRAIRNGSLKAQLGEYTFHHLKRSAKVAAGAPDPTAPAAPAPTQSPAAKPNP